MVFRYMQQEARKQYLLEKYLKLSAMRILSKGLGLLVFLGVLMAGCSDHARKESERCVQRRSAEDSLYVLGLDRMREIDSPYQVSLLSKPCLSDYDTVYWFKGESSWGVFDDFCALYTNDNQWYSSFYHRYPNSQTNGKIATQQVSYKKVQKIRARLDTMGIRCYPAELDTIGHSMTGSNSDPNEYFFVIKEGKSCWYYHWGPRWEPEPYLKKSDTIQEVMNVIRVVAAMAPDTVMSSPDILFKVARLRNGNFTFNFEAPSIPFYLIKDIFFTTSEGQSYSAFFDLFQTDKKSLKKFNRPTVTLEYQGGRKTPSQLAKKR